MKNVLKGNNLLILLILGISACKEKKIIEWHCELERAKEGYNLINEFRSSQDTSFIIDQKSFSYFCYYLDDIAPNDSLAEIMNKIKFSQVVIENKDGQKRLFSKMIAEGTETKDVSFVNCMTDWDANISVGKNHSEKLEISIKYISDLKVAPNDRYVRLHYLFKPNDVQIEKGFNFEFRLTSNWISLDM